MRLETEDHIARENAIALVLCRAWNVSAVRQGDLNHYARVDWKFYRDQNLVGVGECKGRDILTDTYEELYLSAAKYNAIATLAEELRVPGIWVVGFLDPEIRWIYLRDINPLRLTMGGRTDRGAPNDIELMILVPVKKMKKVVDGDYSPGR